MFQGYLRHVILRYTDSRVVLSLPEPEFGSTFPTKYVICTTLSFICQPGGPYGHRAAIDNEQGPVRVLMRPQYTHWFLASIWGEELDNAVSILYFLKRSTKLRKCRS